MLPVLLLLTVALSAADHWTTYLCLSSNTPGWQVTEANPLADWLFSSAGLVEGLLIDSAITIVALAFLAVTPRLPHLVKIGFLSFAAFWTGFAVVNNIQAAQTMGLSLLGG
ncbi:MAG: hypothetical protein HKP30_16705 [Myxococcales bacterium]|nr:hypothetical protein [Myxococcales bacterium]